MKRLFTIALLAMTFSTYSFSQASGSVDLGSEITNGITTGGCMTACIPAYCSTSSSGNHSTQTMALTISGIPASNSVEITFTTIGCGSASGLDSGDDIFINGSKIFDGSGNAALNQIECVVGGADILIEFTANRRDEVINVSWASGTTDPGTGCFLTAAPVEIGYFEANKSKSTIELNWTTSTEINNDHFAVQHSTDGKHFMTLDYIEGNGTTTDTQHYNYTHNNPSSDINFYRLKQVDYDGAYEYSEVKTIRMIEDSRSEFLIYPTVFTDRLFVQSNAFMENVTINIYNTQGALILNSPLQGNEIDLASLAAGTYILQIAEQNNLTTQKIIKL